MTFITTLLKKIDAELLLIDKTDLLMKSEDVYEELFKHKHLLDLSNFPKDSKFFDPVKTKFIGKMKDVSEGQK